MLTWEAEVVCRALQHALVPNALPPSVPRGADARTAPLPRCRPQAAPLLLQELRI